MLGVRLARLGRRGALLPLLCRAAGRLAVPGPQRGILRYSADHGLQVQLTGTEAAAGPGESLVTLCTPGTRDNNTCRVRYNSIDVVPEVLLGTHPRQSAQVRPQDGDEPPEAGEGGETPAGQQAEHARRQVPGWHNRPVSHSSSGELQYLG